METKRPEYRILTVAMASAAVLLLIGLMGVSSANAQGNAGVLLVRPSDSDFTIYTTSTVPVDITDLLGSPLGEGQHGGSVTCNGGGDKCNHKIQLSLISEETEYEYKFSTRQAFDPVERRAVVAGTGTIFNGGQKERFYFTATFEDNRDGTVFVRYEASITYASFVIPRFPGIFEILSR